MNTRQYPVGSLGGLNAHPTTPLHIQFFVQTLVHLYLIASSPRTLFLMRKFSTIYLVYIKLTDRISRDMKSNKSQCHIPLNSW